MLRTSTVVGKLILTGTVAGVCLWIAAGRTGRAQQGGAGQSSAARDLADAPPQVKPAERKDASPFPPAAIGDTAAPEPTLLAPPPAATATSAPDPARELVAPEFTPAPKEPGSQRTTAHDRAADPTAPRQPIATDDPEKDAHAFAEQNRKHAEAQLKALKEEAERLRARLQKVDSGIKRWEALLEALKQSEGESISELNPLPARDNVYRGRKESAAGGNWRKAAVQSHATRSELPKDDQLEPVRDDARRPR